MRSYWSNISLLISQSLSCGRFKSDIGGGEGHDGYGGDSQYNSQQYQHQQYLGDASAAIPTFGNIEVGSEPLPAGITQADLTEFEELYKEHCEVSVAYHILCSVG